MFSRINPESAAGHPDYVRNFRYLSLLKHAIVLGIGSDCRRLVAAGFALGNPVEAALFVVVASRDIRAARVRHSRDAPRQGAGTDGST